MVKKYNSSMVYNLLKNKSSDYGELSQLLGLKDPNILMSVFCSSLIKYFNDIDQEKSLNSIYIINFIETLNRILNTCPDIIIDKKLNHLMNNTYNHCCNNKRIKATVDKIFNYIEKLIMNKINSEVFKRNENGYDLLIQFIYNIKSIPLLKNIIYFYPYYINARSKNDKHICLELIDNLFLLLEENPHSLEVEYFNSVILVFLKRERFHINKNELETYCLKIEMLVESLDTKEKDYKRKLCYYKSILNLLLRNERTHENISVIEGKYNIRKGFESNVLNEVSSLLKKDYIFTIDDEKSQDMDDAISVSLEDDHFHLNVYISDVAYYIKTETQLDIEAYERTETIYNKEIFPMFPFELSHGLFSLNGDEPKRVFKYSCDVYFDGTIKDFKLELDKVKINHRFSYNEVNKILDNYNGKYENKSLIYLEQLANILKRTHSTRLSYNIITQNNLKTKSEICVQECALLVNSLLAQYFFDNNLPFIYRVHNRPSTIEDYEQLLNVEEMIKSNHNDMNKTARIISRLRNILLPASYSINNNGHFGLGFKTYCHATSPIRRYPDLIVERLCYDYLLGEVNSKKDDYWHNSLPVICEHINHVKQKHLQYELEKSKAK